MLARFDPSRAHGRMQVLKERKVRWRSELCIRLKCPGNTACSHGGARMMPPLAQQGLCPEDPYYEGGARQPLMPPPTGGFDQGDRAGNTTEYPHQSGYLSQQTGFYPSPQTGGYTSPQTGAYPSPQMGVYPSPQTGSYTSPQMGGYIPPQMGGYTSSQMGGYPSTHMEGYSSPPTGDTSPKPALEGDHIEKVKCVLVGDGAVGKTSLIVSYTTNGYPTEYVPTAFDNYSVVVTVDRRPVRLQLCDTAGQDDFDSLRPLCYPGSDVFLVCFSVVSPTSFHNVREKWLPELNRHWPGAPVLLVGTQSDLRTDVKVLIELAAAREQPVTEAAAQRLARQIGARAYVESSALTQRNLKEVFDQALLAALDAKRSPAVLNNGSFVHQKQRSSFRNSVRRKKSGIGCVGGDGDCDSLSSETRGTGWKKLCCIV